MSDLYKVCKISRSTFTAYCKGIGIFCNKKEGISPNEFIATYLGEIYPQWYWYEKQDLIKQKNLDKDLPDFYNIQLERLKVDPNGYDVVMIDPNSKGNFTSRMSHSCTSNCHTVTMISNGDYSIGMFSVRNIEFGEELTFDYSSITEKENEFREAICLCGTYLCRGHYLIYTNGNYYSEIINRKHSFLHRNALLLLSSIYDGDLPEEVNDILSRNSIKSSVISNTPDWLKYWAASTCKFIEEEHKLFPYVQYSIDHPEESYDELINGNSTQSNTNPQQLVNNDQQTNNSNSPEKTNPEHDIDLPKENSTSEQSSNLIDKQSLQSAKCTNKESDPNEMVALENANANEKEDKKTTTKDKLFTYKLFSNGLKDSRIQNLIISIDKIKHVLELIKTNGSPLVFLTNEEIHEYLCGNNAYSVRSSLLRCFNQIIPKLHVNMENLRKLIEKIYSILDFKKDKNSKREKDYEALVAKNREMLREVSRLVYKISKDPNSRRFLAAKPLADILYLQSHTMNFFKSNPKYGIPENSVNINILLRDVNTFSKVNQTHTFTNKDLNKVVATGQKKYDRMYIWGQLILWFKQTVNKPNASLSAERRGSLAYPDVDCLFFTNSHSFNSHTGEDTQSDDRIEDTKMVIDSPIIKSKNSKHSLTNSSQLIAPEKKPEEALEKQEISKIEKNVQSDHHMQTRKVKPKKILPDDMVSEVIIKTHRNKVEKPSAKSSRVKGDKTKDENKKIKEEKDTNENSYLFQYPFNSREVFFKKLLENPSTMWPVGNRWSFKNKEKYYGTVQFDSVLRSIEFGGDQNEYLKEVVSSLLSEFK